MTAIHTSLLSPMYISGYTLFLPSVPDVDPDTDTKPPEVALETELPKGEAWLDHVPAKMLP